MLIAFPYYIQLYQTNTTLGLLWDGNYDKFVRISQPLVLYVYFINQVSLIESMTGGGGWDQNTPKLWDFSNFNMTNLKIYYYD